MKSITQSDVYERTASVYKIPEHIRSVLNGAGRRINTEIAPMIVTMQRNYKDSATQKAVEDFEKGSIILVYGDGDVMLPPQLPMIKTIKDNREVVICDLSYTSFEARRDRKTGETSYYMETRQLNSMLLAAHYFLAMRPNTLIPPQTTIYMANAWARMFCKALNRAVYLNRDRDRFDAFRYYAMMYFMINLLDMKEPRAEQVTLSQFKDGKNYIVRHIDEEITARGLTPYNSFHEFCEMLFNKEITGIGGGITGGESMNMASYLRAFIATYDVKALYSLAAFPYFLYLYISVNNANRGFNVRVYEDIMVNNTQYSAVMAELARVL